MYDPIMSFTVLDMQWRCLDISDGPSAHVWPGDDDHIAEAAGTRVYRQQAARSLRA